MSAVLFRGWPVGRRERDREGQGEIVGWDVSWADCVLQAILSGELAARDGRQALSHPLSWSYNEMKS